MKNILGTMRNDMLVMDIVETRSEKPKKSAFWDFPFKITRMGTPTVNIDECMFIS
jgi:hypothetical protein